MQAVDRDHKPTVDALKTHPQWVSFLCSCPTPSMKLKAPREQTSLLLTNVLLLGYMTRSSTDHHKILLNTYINKFSSVLVDKSLSCVVKLTCLSLLWFVFNGLPKQMSQWSLELMVLSDFRSRVLYEEISPGYGPGRIYWGVKSFLRILCLLATVRLVVFLCPMCLPCYTTSPQAEK